MLFVPADSEKKIGKALSVGADALILDLEDSVAPASKPRARAALPSAVKQLHAGGATVFVRVNNEPDLLAGDVAAAVASGADGIVMPKVESPQPWGMLMIAIIGWCILPIPCVVGNT